MRYEAMATNIHNSNNNSGRILLMSSKLEDAKKETLNMFDLETCRMVKVMDVMTGDEYINYLDDEGWM